MVELTALLLEKVSLKDRGHKHMFLFALYYEIIKLTATNFALRMLLCIIQRGSHF